MNININKVKIIVSVPIGYVDKVRDAICNIGAGVIGNYTHCSMTTKCIGTFKSNEKADPFIGKTGQLEFTEEEKLETICQVSMVKDVIAKIREVHPYEEPGIDIIPLIDEEYFK